MLPVLVFACTDYTEDFNTINNRLDALEQSVPTIEEQIESINTQLKSLKATDEAIEEQISELEKSDEATAAEIADLKKKDSALEKSINDLQNYVDTQIANAKSEAAAAYATVEQYNTIVAQLGALQSSTSKLGEELTAKINAEVKSLNDRIADLEARLEAVEDKVESLLARIQSVSYIPEYADGKVKFKHLCNVSFGTLSFRISPKDAVVELEKVWSEALSCEAYYPKTRAVSLVKLAVTEFVGNAENGVVTVKVSGNGLSDEFFAGTQDAKVALVISDSNNQVVSDYADAYGQEVTNEIWYTSTDGNIVEPTRPDAFDANIVSNTYKDGMGILKFDGNVTQIYLYAFCNQETQLGVANLQTIVLPKGVEKIGEFAFCHCSNLTSINIPSSIVSIEDAAFAITPSSLTDVYISNLSDFCKIKFGSGTANPLNTDAYLNLNGNRLTEFIVPEDITTIKFGVFYHNSTIINVVMHDMVTAIGGRAFQGSSIECVTLGSGITNINYDAFASCPNLQKVYCKAVTPPVAKKESDGWKAFNNNHRARMIYVPRESVEAYKSADGWSDYADYIVGYDF